jgi:hypothetical protein
MTTMLMKPTALDAPAVRRWMRLEVHNCGGSMTALAEAAAVAFDADHWLDDPEHWVWDLALEETERASQAAEV